MKHPMYHRHINPGLADGGQGFIILAETTILAQPGKGALDNPTFGQDNECFQVAAPDNFRTHIEQDVTPVQQCRTIIAAIQQQFCPTRIQRHAPEQMFDTIAVCPVRRVNHYPHQPALTIDHDVPFASFHLFAAVVAPRPPFSVVLTDWLSAISKLGSASRPACWRTSTRNWSLSRSQVPSRFSL